MFEKGELATLKKFFEHLEMPSNMDKWESPKSLFGPSQNTSRFLSLLMNILDMQF